MNVLFAVLILISVAILFVFSPESVLSAVTEGGSNALSLTIKTVAIYGFWLGFMEMAKALSVPEALSKLLRPATKFLIGETDEETEKYITFNVSCNMLGLGNMATPLGIEGMKRLCENKDEIPQSAAMFFVINASSIQLVPTTVVSLRLLCGSKSPYDILLPSVIVGIITTILGIVLVKLLYKTKDVGERPSDGRSRL